MCGIHTCRGSTHQRRLCPSPPCPGAGPPTCPGNPAPGRSRCVPRARTVAGRVRFRRRGGEACTRASRSRATRASSSPLVATAWRRWRSCSGGTAAPWRRWPGGYPGPPPGRRGLPDRVHRSVAVTERYDPERGGLRPWRSHWPIGGASTWCAQSPARRQDHEAACRRWRSTRSSRWCTPTPTRCAGQFAGSRARADPARLLRRSLLPGHGPDAGPARGGP